MRPTRARAAFFVVLLLAAGEPALAAAAGAAPAEPAAVVTAFSEAISARKLDEATALFATGGVQFSLRPAHTGLGQQGLTSDLKAHWSMIGPVLFSATSAYSRKAAVLDSRVDGDLATVWARIRTETRQGTAAPRTAEFVEVYLLVRQEGRWKIGAIADNRKPDALVPAPAATR